MIAINTNLMISIQDCFTRFSYGHNLVDVRIYLYDLYLYVYKFIFLASYLFHLFVCMNDVYAFLINDHKHEWQIRQRTSSFLYQEIIFKFFIRIIFIKFFSSIELKFVKQIYSKMRMLTGMLILSTQHAKALRADTAGTAKKVTLRN